MPHDSDSHEYTEFIAALENGPDTELHDADPDRILTPEEAEAFEEETGMQYFPSLDAIHRREKRQRLEKEQDAQEPPGPDAGPEV